ncbi:MAG: hypothetical protein AB1942_23810 [Pseudomonadota bacterium]
MTKDAETGRKANAAQPLGKLPTSGDASGRRKTVARSRAAAGPDGPDAGVVGRTFKPKPG